MKTVVEMAEDVGAYVADLPLEDAVLFEVDILSGRSAKLEAFAALVRAEAQAEEREACAKEAGWLWQQFQDTKDAHERNTMESFNPHRFGFNLSAVQQSRQMMDAIRARGNT